jgi:hypothetical protein
MDAFSLAMQVNSVVSVDCLGGEFVRHILSGHEIPHLLWTLKFEYIIHDNLQLLLILRQMKLVYSLISSFFRLVLMLSSHLCLSLSLSLSPSHFVAEYLYASHILVF